MKFIKKSLPWLIYLSGCLVAYPAGRQCIKNMGGVYTVSDRVEILILSSFSWVSFSAFELYILKQKVRTDNTPAKW